VKKVDPSHISSASDLAVIVNELIEIVELLRDHVLPKDHQPDPPLPFDDGENL